jgi:hypothetical protein
MAMASEDGAAAIGMAAATGTVVQVVVGVADGVAAAEEREAVAVVGMPNPPRLTKRTWKSSKKEPGACVSAFCLDLTDACMHACMHGLILRQSL